MRYRRKAVSMDTSFIKKHIPNIAGMQKQKSKMNDRKTFGNGGFAPQKSENKKLTHKYFGIRNPYF